MPKIFTADIIYPVTSAPVINGAVITDDSGKILELCAVNEVDKGSGTHFNGAIVPGFVNAHCHLELSHMKNVAKTGTGLIEFIKEVITKRNSSPAEIRSAIERGEQEMYDGGIVAVGDISNTTDTFGVKGKGKLRYYTFIEAFDLMDEGKTSEIFDGYKKVYDALETNAFSRKSMSPHAPYSMSPGLFDLINETNNSNGVLTQSIHNQETPPEDDLFRTGKSEFVPFFESWGISFSRFKPLGKTSIHYTLQHLDNKHRYLLVHNTLSTRDDILAAHSKLGADKCFWVTCPNANLYIENRLPDYREFTETDATICIGTDSLTSNWQLSILEEMKTILKYQSWLEFETVLKWATINGAKGLGWQDELGSIEAGKSPGLVHIEGLQEGRLLSNATSRRII